MDDQTNLYLGELIKRIPEGDAHAISEIYIHVGKVMFAVAGIYLSSRADIEEVVQDSLITIVKKAKKFRENKNAYAWITKIVENTAKNKIAYNNRRKSISLDNASISTELNDDYLLIHDALTVLNKNERQIIYYIFWYGLSLSETARMLHKAKSSIKYLLDKTLEKIKNFLKK